MKRLIFDVDGTLITGVDLSVAVKKTLEKLGIYAPSREKLFLEAMKTYEDKFNNYNRRDYIKYFESVIGEELGNSFLDIFFEELKECVPKDSSKIQLVISELAKEYELVLLTNYFKESQLNRLRAMGIDSYFMECFGEELIKPNEKAYIQACGGRAPSECVMIGDNPYLDIEGAKKLGINTIWVNSNGNKEYNGATTTIDSILELSPTLIEKTKELYK